MPFAGSKQIIVWHNGRRVTVGARGSGGPTYADFLAHITTLATSGVAAWSGTGPIGSYRTTAAAATGGMIGSSWGGDGFLDAATCRVVQHGMSSPTDFNALVSSGKQLFVRIIDGGLKASFASLNRNGFTSSALDDGETYSSQACDRIIYWVGPDSGGSAFSMIPQVSFGPTPYTW